MLYAHVPTPWDPNEKPKSQIVGGEAGRHRYRVETRLKSFFRFDDRKPDAEFISNSQYVQSSGKPIELLARRAIPRHRVFIPFEDRSWDLSSHPSKSQLSTGLWEHGPWRILNRKKQKVFFRFKDRNLNVCFEKETQIGSLSFRPNTWYVAPDHDYFPPRLRQWLRGRCFMMIRLRSGVGGGPQNGYITEDGTLFYVAEDGSTFYVQES